MSDLKYTYRLGRSDLFTQPDVNNPDGLDSPYRMVYVSAYRDGKRQFTFAIPHELVEGAAQGDELTFNSITTTVPALFGAP